MLTAHEQAVAFLYQNAQYQIEAVHFAIALSYYGLLRIPTRAKASASSDLSMPLRALVQS